MNIDVTKPEAGMQLKEALDNNEINYATYYKQYTLHVEEMKKLREKQKSIVIK